MERADTPWTSAYEPGAVIEVPIEHAQGRFVADDRVLFRYCDPTGEVTDAANPNGSTGNVAGVLGERETVAVLMPHPERATLPDVAQSTDGAGILTAFA